MKKSKSFSAIEIMVVLAIVSIVLGLTAVYFFNFKSGAVLRLAAHEVAGTLNQARSLAITHQETYDVVFDAGLSRPIQVDGIVPVVLK